MKKETKMKIENGTFTLSTTRDLELIYRVMLAVDDYRAVVPPNDEAVPRRLEGETPDQFADFCALQTAGDPPVVNPPLVLDCLAGHGVRGEYALFIALFGAGFRGEG